MSVIGNIKSAVDDLLIGANSKAESNNQFIYLAVLVAFIATATIVSAGYSRDTENYILMYQSYGASPWGSMVDEMRHHELFFLFTSKVFYKLGLDSIFLFATFAVISLTIKFWLIKEHSRDKVLSLAFLASYFLILHDSTQIRFGLSVAFVYLGMHFLAENKKLLYSVIVIISAILFHNAALFFLVMLLFTSKRSLFWIVGLIFLALILYPLDLNAMLLEFIKSVMSEFGLEDTRLKNVYIILLKSTMSMRHGIFGEIAMLVYLAAFMIFRFRNEFTPYETICYNAFLLSIFFYVLFKDSVYFQVRFGDMFGFSLVFLVPFVHRALSQYINSRMAYVILLAFFAVHLIKYTLYDKMIVL